MFQLCPVLSPSLRGNRTREDRVCTENPRSGEESPHVSGGFPTPEPPPLDGCDMLLTRHPCSVSDATKPPSSDSWGPLRLSPQVLPQAAPISLVLLGCLGLEKAEVFPKQTLCPLLSTLPALML